jgi:hypothetical protein
MPGRRSIRIRTISGTERTSREAEEEGEGALMSYDVSMAFRIDLNMVLMAVAAIVLVASIAVLVKQKGKKR